MLFIRVLLTIFRDEDVLSSSVSLCLEAQAGLNISQVWVSLKNERSHLVQSVPVVGLDLAVEDTEGLVSVGDWSWYC